MNRERIIYLFDRYAEGNWSAEEKQELEAYLLNSSEVQAWFWEHARLSTLLREACQCEAGCDMVDVDTPVEPRAATVGLSLDPSGIPLTDSSSAPSNGSTPATNHNLAFIGDIFSTGGRATNIHLPRLVGLFALAMLLGSALTFWWLGRRPMPTSGAQQNQMAGAKSEQDLSPTATLINVAHCRWDSTNSTADIRNGGRVGPGQSLCLVEGVAEIDCALSGGGVGRFQLEGPSSMMLNSEGMPNLKYGKLAAQINCGFGRYALDTPMGRVVVPYEASIGVASNANELELHVFNGEAIFEPMPLWPAESLDSAEPTKVADGASITVAPSGDGLLLIQRGQADQDRFASQVSMAASRLEISEKYVATIRGARPLAYWRFERDSDGLIRNEMSDDLHCRLYGNGIRWRSYRGNRAIDFGSTPDVGCLMTDDVIDGKIGKSYSVEAWVKPGHFHHGTLLSFVEHVPGPRATRAGLVVELCAPVAGPVSSSLSWARHPGRVRFLHRNPPGDVGGMSCFSESIYAVRKWQHLVASKEDSTLRMFIDGKLVASATQRTPVPEGMRVLIGQLYPHDPGRVVVARPFIGELDEIALYDRAITEEEIAEHYQLAQPVANPPTSAETEF